MTRMRRAARTATTSALLASLALIPLGGCSDAAVDATTPAPALAAPSSPPASPASNAGAATAGAAAPAPSAATTQPGVPSPPLPIPPASTPASTRATSTTAPAALPSAAVPQHGQRYWAVVVAVATDPAAPVLLDAERRLARLGYSRPNRAEVDCLQGASEALRLPDTGAYEVDVLFTSRAAADRLAAAYPGGVVGVARVTAYCLD